MAGTLTVGILRALLTLDTAQFHGGMREAAGSAQAFQRKIGALGRNFTQLGTTLTGAVTVPLVAAFGGATKAAIDFESSFAGVRKTVNASTEEFAALSDQFREMATRIPININELNRLGETAGALGIPKQRIGEFVETIAKIGVTTNVAAEQAATDIAAIQNIFGAAGVSTKNFASALVALGNDGASSESDILALTTRIASAGNTVGMSQQQVMGFAAAIANVKMEAEAGGSAMSRVILEMSKAVSAGGEDLAKFARVSGMSSATFAQLFKTDAAGAMQAFIAGLGRVKTTGGDLNATLNELGFTEIRQGDLLRRLAGASDMVGQSVTLANTAWTQNLALDKEASTRFATTASSLTTLANQFIDIGVTFGTALKPLIDATIGVMQTTVLPIVKGLAEAFASLPVPVQAAIVGFAGLFAAAGPLLLIAGQLAMGISALVGLGGFAGLMTVMSTVATFITGGLTAAFTAILPFLGPIGLIAAGVTAVVLAWKYWDQIVAFFQGAWQFVVQSVKSIPSDLLLPLLGPIGLVVATFKHWDQITAIAQAVYTAIKTWLVDKFNAIVDSIGQKVKAVTGFFATCTSPSSANPTCRIWSTGIGDEFGRLDGVMVDPARRSTSLVQGLFSRMASSVEGIVSGLFTKLSTKIDELLGKLTSKLTGWLDSFMPSWAAKFIGGMANDVLGGLSKHFLGEGGLARGLLGKVPGLSGLLGGGGGGGGGLLGGLLGGGGSAASGLFAAGGASSGLASGAAINATTAGLAGGGAGAGGGLGASMTSLLTNPITIGVGAGLALTWAIWKKGLFRGGEEALKVSPRRDMFLKQFGDPANKGTGGAGWNLASALVQAGQGDGGGPLFRAFQKADTVEKFESAQQSIVALLKRTGLAVHSFAQGGIIPPGVVTAAVLHGGDHGEIIAPLDKMPMGLSMHVSIQAMDGASVERVFRESIIPRMKMAFLLNTDGLVTAQRRALEA